MATLETGAVCGNEAACKLFSEHSTRLSLSPLSPADVELLLQVLFGGVPHVEGWAQPLWSLSEGNPRQLMRLAQHLVESGIVRYQAGTWVLPSALSAAELPLSASQAQHARVAALSARALAWHWALCPDLPFRPQECAQLITPAADGVQIASVCEELLRSEIVRSMHNEQWVLAHPTWIAILRADFDPEATCRTQLRLSEVLAARGDQAFRVGRHLLLAGETDRGLDVLTRHAHDSQEQTALSEQAFLHYVRSLPPDWHEVFQRAIRLCSERSRPRSERYALLSRLAGILAMQGQEDKPHLDELMTELADQAGSIVIGREGALQVKRERPRLHVAASPVHSALWRLA